MLGHTQANTTYRYVNANIETTRRGAAALDTFNSGAPEKGAMAEDLVEEGGTIIEATNAVN